MPSRWACGRVGWLKFHIYVAMIDGEQIFYDEACRMVGWSVMAKICCVAKGVME